jgi:hypothetical protein
MFSKPDRVKILFEALSNEIASPFLLAMTKRTRFAGLKKIATMAGLTLK